MPQFRWHYLNFGGTGHRNLGRTGSLTTKTSGIEGDGVAEVETREACAGEVGADEVCSTEVGLGKVGVGEVQPRLFIGAELAPPTTERQPADWLCLAERVIGGWAPTLRAALLIAIVIVGVVVLLALLLGVKTAAILAGVAAVMKALLSRVGKSTHV